MELRIIWNILWRRKWVIIPVAALIFFCVVFAGARLPKIYETESSVFISSSPSADAILTMLGLTDTASIDDLDAETRTEMLVIGDILTEVIDRLSLRDRRDDLLTLKDFQKNKFITASIWPQPYVEFEQYEDTHIIEIKACSGDTAEAAMIANTVMDVCIEKDAEHRMAVFSEIRKMINRRIDKVHTDYMESLDAVLAFRLKNKSLDVDTEIRSVADRLMALFEEKEGLRSSIANLKVRMTERKRLLESETSEGLSNAVIADNSVIQSLRQAISELELELSGLKSEKTDKHPDVISLNNRLKQAHKELASELVIHKASSSELQDMEVELIGYNQNLKSLEEEVGRYIKLAGDYAGMDRDMTILQERLIMTQSMNEKANSMLMKLSLVETLFAADVRVIGRAVEPDWDDPESPKILLLAVIAIFLSCVFGIGGALVFDYVDDRVIDGGVIAEMGPLLLGDIPKVKGSKGTLIVGRAPGDILRESYRCVRNSIKAMCGTEFSGCITVASCLKGEGSSTVAANLAISLAEEGWTVLAVDADFHNPGLDRAMRVSAGSAGGLGDVLEGSVEFKSAMVSTGIERLSLMPSGKISSVSDSMIESGVMKDFLMWAAAEYDVVIVDAPSAAVSDHAVVLGEMSNSVVLVVEYGRVAGRVVENVVRRMTLRNIKFLGVVMNKSWSSKNIFF